MFIDVFYSFLKRFFSILFFNPISFHETNYQYIFIYIHTNMELYEAVLLNYLQRVNQMMTVTTVMGVT